MMQKNILIFACSIFLFSCKKESTNPTKYQLKSYTILSNQFNTSNVRDSVTLEYNKSKIVKAVSYYKYDLNAVGPTKSITFSNGKNKIESATFIKDAQSYPILLEYDTDNLLKKIEGKNSAFNIRYNTSKKVSGLTFNFSNFIDFEIQNENVVNINRSGNIQKNEFDTSNNPFFYISDDAKIIMMAEFGNSIFLNYYNGFSKNSIKNYTQDKKDYTISYKLNKANLPIEAIITLNTQKFSTIKFYY